MVVRKIIILFIGLILSSHAMAQTDKDVDLTRTFFNSNKTYTILGCLPGNGDVAISCKNSFITIQDELIHIRLDDNSCYNFTRIVGDIKEYHYEEVSSLTGRKLSFNRWLYQLDGGGAISVARNQFSSQKETYLVSIFDTGAGKHVVTYEIIDNTEEIE